MEITGPAAGSDLLKTEADPTGTRTLGTWNNCGNGETPWGTYLACEENFNSYFSSTDPDYERSPAMQRYGVNIEDWGYGWAKIDERFDISRHPNEANRAGYVVEIDPFDPLPPPRSGLHSVGSSTRMLMLSLLRTGVLSSTWAMTSGASSSIASSRTGSMSRVETTRSFSLRHPLCRKVLG